VRLSAGNAHATAVVFGDRGILITGASGSGKTALAFAVLDAARLTGRFGRLVADDQVLLSESGGRLIGHAPPAIEGMAEVHGLGPVHMAVQPAAVIDLAVSLVSTEAAPRLGAPEQAHFGAVSVPLLILAERQALANARLIAAWFEGTMIV